MASGKANQYRLWYQHERDCNARVLNMLESVPAENQSDPKFQQAVGLFAHLLVARSNWLIRFETGRDKYEEWFPTKHKFPELQPWAAEVEAEWTAYLGPLDDESVTRVFRFGGSDANAYEWTIEGILAQLNIHHAYHRAQIALLVDQLGGKTDDTDYIYWAFRELDEAKKLG